MLQSRTVTPSVLARVVVFYLAFLVLLTLILTKHLGDILPSGAANQIGHNSEGYVIGIVACAWIQWMLPASINIGRSLPIGVLGGAVSLGVAIILKTGGFPSTVGTLNEAFFALAFVLPYVHLTGRVGWAPAFSIALVIALLLAHDTSIVVKGAEAWVVLVLAPLGFDVFDRALLDRSAHTNHVLRLVWMAILVAIPLAAMILDHNLGHGHAEGIRDYIARANEAFVGVFIVHAYFGYWVPSLRPRPSSRQSVAAVTA